MLTDTTGPKKSVCPVRVLAEAAPDGAAFFIGSLDGGIDLPLRGHALEAAIAALDRATDEARSDWYERRECPDADVLHRRFVRLAEALTAGLRLLSIEPAGPLFLHL